MISDGIGEDPQESLDNLGMIVGISEIVLEDIRVQDLEEGIVNILTAENRDTKHIFAVNIVLAIKGSPTVIPKISVGILIVSGA